MFRVICGDPDAAARVSWVAVSVSDMERGFEGARNAPLSKNRYAGTCREEMPK